MMDTLFPTYRHFVLIPTLIIFLSLAIISVTRMFSVRQCDIPDYLLLIAIGGIMTWCIHRASKAAIRDGGIYWHTVVWLYLHTVVLSLWGLIMSFWIVWGIMKAFFGGDPGPIAPWNYFVLRVLGENYFAYMVIMSGYVLATIVALCLCVLASMVPIFEVSATRAHGLLSYSETGTQGDSNAGDPESAGDKMCEV